MGSKISEDGDKTEKEEGVEEEMVREESGEEEEKEVGGGGECDSNGDDEGE